MNVIFSPQFLQLLAILQNSPELGFFLKEIIKASSSSELKPTEQEYVPTCQLEKMGLRKFTGNSQFISSELFHHLFADQNFDNLSTQSLIEQLQAQNLYLKQLCYVDDLTQLYNQRYFHTYLENSWKRSIMKNTSLSLIFLDIDNLKIYNLTCGHQAGDECVQKIAGVISNCLNKTNAVATRYQDDTFAIILNHTTTDVAFEIAETIRSEVKQLAIKHAINRVGGLKLPVVTVSLGVACTIPLPEQPETILIDAAFAALRKAKKLEGNCTCISE